MGTTTLRADTLRTWASSPKQRTLYPPAPPLLRYVHAIASSCGNWSRRRKPSPAGHGGDERRPAWSTNRSDDPAPTGVGARALLPDFGAYRFARLDRCSRFKRAPAGSVPVQPGSTYNASCFLKNRFSAASSACDRTAADTSRKRSQAMCRMVRSAARERDWAMATGS